jgi:hypothetical protein
MYLGAPPKFKVGNKQSKINSLSQEIKINKIQFIYGEILVVYSMLPTGLDLLIPLLRSFK